MYKGKSHEAYQFLSCPAQGKLCPRTRRDEGGLLVYLPGGTWRETLKRSVQTVGSTVEACPGCMGTDGCCAIEQASQLRPIWM